MFPSDDSRSLLLWSAIVGGIATVAGDLVRILIFIPTACTCDTIIILLANISPAFMASTDEPINGQGRSGWAHSNSVNTWNISSSKAG